MSSIFPGRRKPQRPVSTFPHEDDPWGMREEPSSDEAGSSSSGSRTAAVRILHTVRRFSSGAPKKRGHAEGGMYSTPAESRVPTMSGYSFHNRPDTRPTIQEIAMGLHISRTPHLLSPRTAASPHLNSPGRSVEQTRLHNQLLTRPNAHIRRASTSAITLPRSSLKKCLRPQTAGSTTLVPSASDASLSTLTTQTSNGPGTPKSAQSTPTTTSFPGKLRLEMLRLLSHRRGSFSGTASTRSQSPGVLTPSSDADSMSAGLAPRKSVRFSAGEHAPQDEA